MKFLIRADASIQIGSGHIMRCLTLARELQKHGHCCNFVMRAHTGNLAELVREQGFECMLLPEISGSLKVNTASSLLGQWENEPLFHHSAWLGCTQEQDLADCAAYIRAQSPDWIICDHYALSDIWQYQAKQISGSKIMVIDDLHDRPHAADLLLDQNYGRSTQDYVQLVPKHCGMLMGTHYVLLREEFATWRKIALVQQQASLDNLKPQNVFVNLGGVDKDNYTLAILQQLSGCLKRDSEVCVIMGATAPHIASVQAFAKCAPFECRVIINASNMAELMAQADWAIGAAGGTSWERCCLGVPTLLLVIADNQREVAQALHTAGAAFVLEEKAVNSPEFAACLQHFRRPETRRTMSTKAAALCDGLGATRVTQYIEKYDAIQNLRRATLSDSRLLYMWRNHQNIRRFMRQTQAITWATHRRWLARQLGNPDYVLLIYYENGTPLGSVNFTRITERVCEWGFYAAPDAPRGTGTKMLRTAIAWARLCLDVEKICAQVREDNVASVRLHEKLGFRRLPACTDGFIAFELEEENEWFQAA